MPGIFRYALAFLLGVVSVLGLQRIAGHAQGDGPAAVVEAYLEARATGNVTQAMQYLTGEAAQVAGAVPWKAEPIRSVQILSSEDAGEIARVRARWVTDASVDAADFYLARTDGTWRIFSAQAPTIELSGAKKAALPEDARKTIEAYVRAVAAGNRDEALSFLTGDALRRAGPVALSPQKIELGDVRTIGVLPAGTILVRVEETIESGVQHARQTLLFALDRVGDGWKISDVRLVSRDALQ